MPHSAFKASTSIISCDSTERDIFQILPYIQFYFKKEEKKLKNEVQLSVFNQ